MSWAGESVAQVSHNRRHFNCLVFFLVCSSLHHSRQRYFRRQLFLQSQVGPFAGTLASGAVGSRLYFIPKTHGCIGSQFTQTRIVHYRNWDGRLHPLAAHPEKVAAHHKSSVHYQKWVHPRSSSTRSLPASLTTSPFSLVDQDSNTHNFHPSYQNWMLFDSLAS